MKQLKYNMVLQGLSNWLNPSLNVKIEAGTTESEPDGSTRILNIASTAKYEQINIFEGAHHLAYILQSSLRNGASFVAQITPTVDGTFHETGQIWFGDGKHQLQISTANPGQLIASPDPDCRQGAVTFTVEGGTGLFEGATGIITANFMVSKSGDYRDAHTGVIFLSGEDQEDKINEDNRMRVRNVIDEKAFPVLTEATMEYVADLLALTGSSELMVIDNEGNFIGVLSEVELLRAVIPDIDEIIKGGGTLNDALNIFIQSGRDLAGQPITRLVKNNPRTVAPNDELLAVATVMLQSDTRRLPVVEDNKFVGSVSLADICWAILSKWNGLRQH